MKKDTQTYTLITEALKTASTSSEAKRALYLLIVQNRVDFTSALKYDSPTRWEEELKSCKQWLKTKNEVYKHWIY